MAVTNKSRLIQEIIKAGKDPVYFFNNYPLVELKKIIKIKKMMIF